MYIKYVDSLTPLKYMMIVDSNSAINFNAWEHI